jgi:hypothetical protein
MRKTGLISGIIVLAISIALLVGEVKCIIKMINCNWEPIGKAEVIYTAATFTGVGCIVGYIDIQDK